MNIGYALALFALILITTIPVALLRTTTPSSQPISTNFKEFLPISILFPSSPQSLLCS